METPLARPSAMMLPVEVPANRSMLSRTLLSRFCRSFAVITPKMPPPSHARILYVASVMDRAPFVPLPSHLDPVAIGVTQNERFARERASRFRGGRVMASAPGKARRELFRRLFSPPPSPVLRGPRHALASTSSVPGRQPAVDARACLRRQAETRAECGADHAADRLPS